MPFRALALGVLGAACIILSPPCLAGAAASDAGSVPDDAATWFRRIQESAQRNSFVGTFVVSAGGRMSSSRIAHYCEGQNQLERVDALDGQTRRMFRYNDTVHILWPTVHKAVVERREVGMSFPGILRNKDPGTAQFYDVIRERTDRVAGHDATVLLLRPRDELRYAQRLWTEVRSGLLLRADVLSPGGDVLESSAFSEIDIGAKVQPAPIRQEMNRLDGYTVIRPVMTHTDLDSEGWTMHAQVPGFKPLSCVKRSIDTLSGDSSGPSTIQAIFSDGLTHISLFIEPSDPARAKPDQSSETGATHALSVVRGAWRITAVGDVPQETLRKFVSNLERRKP